jgi:hypothetical protein
MARFGSIGTQYFDSNGDPLSGGKLYFYASGTSTAKDTFTTAGYTVANTNPVILSAGGRQPNIFFNGSAKAILTDSSGVQIESRDPVGDTSTTAFAPWSSTEIYSSADIVTASDGSYYSSLQNNNINNNPVTPSPTYWSVLNIFAVWSATTTYAQFQLATGSNGNIYYSLAGTNLNNNPVTDTSNTYWIGSVRGPGVAVTDRIVTFNGTTGNRIKDSGTLISGLATSGANSNITSLSGLTTPLSTGQGGTGQSSNFTQYGVVYAPTTTTLGNTGAGTTTTVLHGNAAGAPTYGAVSLTTDVTGTLPIANGGTNGTASPTANGVTYGDGTAYAFTAAGTTGQILTATTGSPPTWSTPASGSPAGAIIYTALNFGGF